MVETVPHDVLISYVVGHLFAVVCPRSAEKTGSLRDDFCFKRALAFQLLVFVPIGIFLLIVQPSWSFLYLVDPVGPLVILRVVGILCYVAAMLIGYVHGASLARKGNLAGSLISIGLVLAAATLLFIAVVRRFFFIGTYEEFHALGGDVPVNFFEPQVLIIAAVVGVYFIVPMIYVLHKNRNA